VVQVLGSSGVQPILRVALMAMMRKHGRLAANTIPLGFGR
jgi:hypothetical protein